MSVSDLTRWNRAGLSQLDYIEGNAATYLEDLRLALRTQFASEPAVLNWLGEAVTDKNQQAWLERLIAQYTAERRDYAWEMIRSFVRAAHVLTQTINAYANERYIRTATQWDNVRRLVSMLDYRPAPPASAETYLALMAKVDNQAVGSVEKGLAIKNQPGDGGTPLTFETLEDIRVDYRINQLRVAGFDQSVDELSIPSKGETFTYAIPDQHVLPKGISVGDRGVLSFGLDHVAVMVSDFSQDTIDLTIIEKDFSGAIWKKSGIQLHLTPKWDSAPNLNGSTVIEVDQPNMLVAVGDVLAYQMDGSWHPRKVIAIQGKRIQLNASVIGAPIFFRAQSIPLQSYGDHYQVFVAPLEREVDTLWDQDLNEVTPDYEYVVDADGDATSDHLFHYVWDHLATEVYYLPQGSPSTFSAVNIHPAALQYPGKPGDILTDDWVLLHNADGDWVSHQVNSVDTKDGFYELDMLDSLGGDVWQYSSGHFTDSLHHRSYDKNETPAFTDATNTSCQLTLLLNDLPEVLVTGRMLWVVSSTSATRVTLVKVLSTDPISGTTTLIVTPSLAGQTFPKYDTWIYGNVVKAGHGETRAKNVLGDGNRVKKNQRFTYKKTGLAFEQDSEFSSGVSAAIEVCVDNRRWKQVDSLRNANATDTFFETKLNEDAALEITFGDGAHGQRLPTGINNVTIQARFGNGVQGNLSAGSLNKLKKNHALVGGVCQPVQATGGGDMENTRSLKTLAPASVLSLDRAVSVSDYAHLAQRQSSIWQARAFALPDIPGATDRVEVVLVPAEGGDLGELQNSLRDYLTKYSRPGVEVTVSRYQALLLDLRVTIRVDAQAYDGELVRAAVEAALKNALSLQKVTLGESLYRASIYQIIEQVEGVENVEVNMNPEGFVDEQGLIISPKDTYIADDGSLRRITPTDRQLIYLNTSLVGLDIGWEADHG